MSLEPAADAELAATPAARRGSHGGGASRRCARGWTWPRWNSRFSCWCWCACSPGSLGAARLRAAGARLRHRRPHRRAVGHAPHARAARRRRRVRDPRRGLWRTSGCAACAAAAARSTARSSSSPRTSGASGVAMSRMHELEARRRVLLARCELQRARAGGALRGAEGRPAEPRGWRALRARRRTVGGDARCAPLTWAVGIAGLLLLRRPRQVLTVLEWARAAVAFGSKAALLLRVLGGLRALRSTGPAEGSRAARRARASGH